MTPYSTIESATISEKAEAGWRDCRFLTCSVLPVRMACNLICPFCFSKSSISTLGGDAVEWSKVAVEAYFEFARLRGATRLVITGGGEPLLRPNAVVDLVARGRHFFGEIACFTNGTYFTRELADRLAEAGLSYVCYSRHHDNDDRCRTLMGRGAPDLADFVAAAGPLKIRATCVMTQGWIETTADVLRYMNVVAGYGVREFTFKHTYVAYERSVFGGSRQDSWARRHQIQESPLKNWGEVVARLPWGPNIRRRGALQACYYFEPTPAWEQEHQLCRSSNLLSNGRVYASLEDEKSLLFQVNDS
jgi:MoaA/NifB/PqqE/SkfB family radical SAM enzyme